MQRTVRKILLAACLTSGAALALAEGLGGLLIPNAPAVLSAAEAFNITRPEAARIQIDVAEGVYLYDERIRVEHSDGQPVAVVRPVAMPIDDPVFGPTGIHRGRVELTLETTADTVILHYQGCADIGFCYPPMQTELSFSR